MESQQSSRLGECEVCGANAAKYTCPKCEVKTCTLKCVNIHKKELECDGIRDKTRYVPMSQFTNLDLLSDYRLLEDATRAVETLKKDKSKKYTRQRGELPRHLFILKKGLQTRNTTIQFLPGNFEKHKKNTTYIDFKTKIIYWRIELIFSQADNLKIVQPKCEESLKLSTIVNNVLYSNELLKYYQSTGLSGLNFYLKADMKSGEKYYLLDPSLNIKDNLKNKLIIEFPIIYIVFKDHSYLFETVDSSDEETENSEVLNPVKYISKIVNKENATEKKKGNLLFNTEYSDLEISDEEL